VRRRGGWACAFFEIRAGVPEGTRWPGSADILPGGCGSDPGPVRAVSAAARPDDRVPRRRRSALAAAIDSKGREAGCAKQCQRCRLWRADRTVARGRVGRSRGRAPAEPPAEQIRRARLRGCRGRRQEHKRHHARQLFQYLHFDLRFEKFQRLRGCCNSRTTCSNCMRMKSLRFAVFNRSHQTVKLAGEFVPEKCDVHHTRIFCRVSNRLWSRRRKSLECAQMYRARTN